MAGARFASSQPWAHDCMGKPALRSTHSKPSMAGWHLLTVRLRSLVAGAAQEDDRAPNQVQGSSSPLPFPQTVLPFLGPCLHALPAARPHLSRLLPICLAVMGGLRKTPDCCSGPSGCWEGVVSRREGVVSTCWEGVIFCTLTHSGGPLMPTMPTSSRCISLLLLPLLLLFLYIDADAAVRVHCKSWKASVWRTVTLVGGPASSACTVRCAGQPAQHSTAQQQHLLALAPYMAHSRCHGIRLRVLDGAPPP